MKVKVTSLTMSQYHSDIKIIKQIVLKIAQPFVNMFYMFCAFIRPRYQVSVNRTIGPLVVFFYPFCLSVLNY